MDHSQAAHNSGAKLRRRVRLNTVVIPQVRALGFAAIVMLCSLHHALISAYISDQALVLFIAAAAAYNLVSWGLLWRFYARTRAVDLSQVFLCLDVILWMFAIYATGAEKSWFLLLLVLRSADQAANGFTTALRFAHWSTAAYLGLLLYVQFGEQRPLNWSVEALKLLGIYFANLYVCLTALALERVRRQMRSARHLILRLQRKTRELDQERHPG